MTHLWRILCFILLSTPAPARDTPAPAKLSEADIQFLNRLLTVKPGMTEAEVRACFPALGKGEAPANEQPGVAHRLPEFSLGGLKWHSEFRLVDGKLLEAQLFASAMAPGVKVRDYEPHQRATREEIRASCLRIAAWYQQRIGTVTERFVPNLDCPAGSPLALRHTWLTQRRAVALQFFKVSSHSSITLTLADWKSWNADQKRFYESSWPLQPATKAKQREAGSPER